MMTETQAWSLKFNEVANLIRHLKSRKPLNSTDELWLKSLKSDAKQIIGNLKKLAAKDPAAAQAVKRFSQELRAFDANTIKQQMAYHAREYRRLKAMTNDARTAIRRVAIVAYDANSARTARIELMANQLMEKIDRLFDYGTEEQIKAKWPALKASVEGFLRNYGSAVREDNGLMETMNDLQYFLRTNSGKKVGRRMMN